MIGHAGQGTTRLPRTRGDRPYDWPRRARNDQAPPHTRGSTPRRKAAAETITGSPAHAGIDLQNAHQAMSSRRLPRTRGDRPGVRAAHQPERQAPPHTRGSTRPAQPSRPIPMGSPAHAGIDLTDWFLAQDRPRLPRTRGDRPRNRSSRPRGPQAPPHTRGSTRVGGRMSHRSDGSPAHAGIDPRYSETAYARPRLPRTAGIDLSLPAAWHTR